MDKKEKKLAEEALKNSLMPGMGSNPAAFLDAASLLGKNLPFKTDLWQFNNCFILF